MTKPSNTSWEECNDDPKHSMGPPYACNHNLMFYALTLKHNTNYLTDKQYMELLKAYLNKFEYVFVESRFEKKGKVHFHGTFIAPRGLKFKPLMSKGYHVYIRSIYRSAGWRDYISKESNPAHVARNDQKLYERESRERYLFI